jgi:5'-nucleotidase (lipoprotein e(P4) family)
MFRITARSLLAAALAVLSLTGCSPLGDDENTIDLGVQWVRSAAEYEALSLQAYGAATEDLQKFIDDTSWSALPGQIGAADLPVAIIADVDETMVSNVEFQVVLVQPFSNSVMNTWNDENTAKPIPGATEFVRMARDAGVEFFFVTNRPCEKKNGINDPCPQEGVTLQDLKEVGIEVDSDHLMLADENLGWDREKLSRREHIAKTHRVIMLLGDDLSDFIACSRKKLLHPCAEGASIASRQAATNEFSQYWGEGWYVLPNPMHGSWTSVN